MNGALGDPSIAVEASKVSTELEKSTNALREFCEKKLARSTCVTAPSISPSLAETERVVTEYEDISFAPVSEARQILYTYYREPTLLEQFGDS